MLGEVQIVGQLDREHILTRGALVAVQQESGFARAAKPVPVIRCTDRE